MCVLQARHITTVHHRAAQSTMSTVSTSRKERGPNDRTVGGCARYTTRNTRPPCFSNGASRYAAGTALGFHQYSPSRGRSQYPSPRRHRQPHGGAAGQRPPLRPPTRPACSHALRAPAMAVATTAAVATATQIRGQGTAGDGAAVSPLPDAALPRASPVGGGSGAAGGRGHGSTSSDVAYR